MALIRVARCYDIADPKREDEVILNTAHIVLVQSDNHKPPRGVWVQLVHGEPLLAKMSLDDFWNLIQHHPD